MYAAWEGLFRRNAEGKKGELVADDWDEMAKVLLGPKADGNNLGSVEAIMKSLPHDQAQALLAHVKQDKNWVEKPSQQAVAEDKLAWFKDISLKLSL
jgi:hypothetical protein